MTLPLSVVVVLALQLLPTQTASRPVQPAVADVAAVRNLYAGAEYENALALISSLPVAAITPEHEQYRALCLLALGRAEESAVALERLVTLNPTYALPEADVSPRITTMFRDVRRRVLPRLVRDRYAEGKRLYDERNFAEAVKALKAVQVLLTDPELAYPADAFADLRQLADGFARLAELEIAQAAATAAAAAAAPSAASAPGIVITKIQVYSSENSDVTPPVEIERYMPSWVPPAAVVRSRQEYRGELEVVIDEAGQVEQARMTRPTVQAYDLALTAATRRWRFVPARRGGQTVKYVLTFQVVLAPGAERR
jgi:TonB family protein